MVMRASGWLGILAAARVLLWAGAALGDPAPQKPALARPLVPRLRAGPHNPVHGAPARPAAAAPSGPACTEVHVPALQDRLPFGPGETLEYSATLRGLPAGSVTMQVKDRATRDGKVVYPVSVTASGNPVVSLWARLTADATTYLDPDNAAPVAFESRTRGDKMQYQEDVTFEHGAHALQARTTLNGKALDARMAAEGQMVDALSIVFFARSRDFRVGQPFCIDLYQSRLLWRVRGAVVRTETLETDAGPFETFVAQGEARAVGQTKGITAQPRAFTAWMTMDEDRIPVRLDAPTPWGDVTARLTRFEQGRRLVRSKDAPPQP
jgi:hypothetical protein